MRRLSKSFGSPPRRALDGLDLEAAAGSIVAVIGPNGSGKTTLLRVLAGLVTPDSGQARVFGIDPAASPEEAQRRSALAPAEDRSFYGRLTGRENLRFFAALRGIPKEKLESRLTALEAALRLSEFLSATFQAMSSGMKQRLALARALVPEPNVLLLDEPCRSLDSDGAAGLLSFVRDEYLGRADRLAIWTTVRPEEAREAGSLVAALGAGRHGSAP